MNKNIVEYTKHQGVQKGWIEESLIRTKETYSFRTKTKGELFYYFTKYYSILSEIQSLLIHHGAFLFLARGKLLNAYRDGGYYPDGGLRYYSWGTVLGLWDECKWLHTDGDDKIHTTICSVMNTYVSNSDEIEYFMGGGLPSMYETTDRGTGIIIYEFNLINFPDFPNQILEIPRYCTSADIPDRCSNYYPVVDNKDDFNIKLKSSLKTSWLDIRSICYLYNSPFWTMNTEFIELYLIQNYGPTWNVPISYEDIE